MDGNVDKESLIKETVKHSKKITEAVYRITELFPEKEPLKWLLRNESVEIFKLFLGLNNARLDKRIKYFDRITGRINKIIGFLEIAASNSFVANINFGILKREYEKINSFIINNKIIYFPEPEIFELKLEEALLPNFIGHNGQNFKEEKSITIKESDLFSFIGASNDFSKEKNVIKNENNDIEIESERNENTAIHNLNTFPRADKKLHLTKKETVFSSRENKILDIIKSKENRTIKINEVFSCFSGISKKTIQRDLSKLVKSGALKMGGVKRWRTYKL